MADTVFSHVGVNTGDLLAVDNGGGTYSVAISVVSGVNAAQDSVFATDPPLKAVYLGNDSNGKKRYGIAVVLV